MPDESSIPDVPVGVCPRKERGMSNVATITDEAIFTWRALPLKLAARAPNETVLSSATTARESR
jgi:hypothetical protein